MVTNCESAGRVLHSPAARRFARILLLLFLLSSVACASTPEWIHALPSRRASPVSDLSGRWLRSTPSLYRLADPDAHSVGLESIQIEADENQMRFEKLHLFVEVVGGRYRAVGFRETGSLLDSGVWVLLSPIRAWRFENEFELPVPAGNAMELTRLPDPAEIQWHAIDPGPDLLYYLEIKEERSTLIPLAFERLGVVYDFGLFRVSTAPYRHDSDSFQNAVEALSYKLHRPHAYVRESRHSQRN